MPFASRTESSIDAELKFQRPELAQFLSYWDTKRAERLFPARDDIIPREIQNLLPWVHMYDVPGPLQDGNFDAAAGVDFCIRLVGTGLAEFFGETDFRGKPISTLPSPSAENLRGHLTRLLQARAPIRTFNLHTSIPNQEFQGSEGCYAPLSSDGARIDMIIAVTMLELRK